MVKIMAVKKGLSNKKRKNAIIYVENLAEFARAFSYNEYDVRDRLALNLIDPFLLTKRYIG